MTPNHLIIGGSILDSLKMEKLRKKMGQFANFVKCNCFIVTLVTQLRQLKHHE